MSIRRHWIRGTGPELSIRMSLFIVCSTLSWAVATPLAATVSFGMEERCLSVVEQGSSDIHTQDCQVAWAEDHCRQICVCTQAVYRINQAVCLFWSTTGVLCLVESRCHVVNASQVSVQALFTRPVANSKSWCALNRLESSSPDVWVQRFVFKYWRCFAIPGWVCWMFQIWHATARRPYLGAGRDRLCPHKCLIPLTYGRGHEGHFWVHAFIGLGFRAPLPFMTFMSPSRPSYYLRFISRVQSPILTIALQDQLNKSIWHQIRNPWLILGWCRCCLC